MQKEPGFRNMWESQADTGIDLWAYGLYRVCRGGGGVGGGVGFTGF